MSREPLDTSMTDLDVLRSQLSNARAGCDRLADVAVDLAAERDYCRERWVAWMAEAMTDTPSGGTREQRLARAEVRAEADLAAFRKASKESTR